MSDIPEADAQEQRQSVGDRDDDTPRLGDEVPEADAMEQAEGLRHVGRPRKERSAEVPEADAYEQELEVEDDDEGME